MDDATEFPTLTSLAIVDKHLLFPLFSQLGEFRSALLHDSKSAQSRGATMMGGAGETPFEIRRRMLDDRERKLRKMLDSLAERRSETRRNRFHRLGMPVVAVVGYTNSGKTSLIKALTGDKQITPQVDSSYSSVCVWPCVGISLNMGFGLSTISVLGDSRMNVREFTDCFRLRANLITTP